MVFEEDPFLRAYKLKSFQTRNEAVEYKNQLFKVNGKVKNIFAMDIEPSGKKVFLVATLGEF